MDVSEESKFATKTCHVIDSRTAKGKYSQSNSIKFETETIKSSLCDYCDVFVLVTGDITVATSNNTHVAFKIHMLHYLHVKQKLMICLLMKQIIFTVQCLCTI